jgi:hypothetical protein
MRAWSFVLVVLSIGLPLAPIFGVDQNKANAQNIPKSPCNDLFFDPDITTPEQFMKDYPKNDSKNYLSGVSKRI